MQFFVLDVYNSDGTPLTVDQIYIQLEKIWNSSLQTNKEPIGILTSNHRNSWGKAYNNLIKGGHCQPEHVSEAERRDTPLNIPLCGRVLCSVAHGQSKRSANVPLTLTGKPNPAQITLWHNISLVGLIVCFFPVYNEIRTSYVSGWRSACTFSN